MNAHAKYMEAPSTHAFDLSEKNPINKVSVAAMNRIRNVESLS